MTELYSSWERMWLGLNARGDGTAIRDDLISRYAQPHRHYHTLQHLAECIEWFESISALAKHPAELETALWFHDAIYELDGGDNEERSAKLASDALAGAGVPAESVSRIGRLVVLTRHTELPESLDEQFVVDIDLAILAASEQRFAEYERQIREEYAFMPANIFDQKRREILSSFLKRKTIYCSDYFKTLLEARARANLKKTLK